MKLTTRTREREKHDHRLLVKVAASSSHTREREGRKNKSISRHILKKKNLVVVMCDNSTLVNSTTGLASASAILNACACSYVCCILSFVFSSPFFCVPFLFRVLENPKRFFSFSFVPSFVQHHFTRKYLLTFVKMMMHEEEEEEERETPSKARGEKRARVCRLYFSFFSLDDSVVLLFSLSSLSSF